MFNLHGKYETAKVFTDLCESEAIAQIINLLNQEFMANAHPRFMPDVHAGKGCTVGTTMHITDKVCPNLVGVDIGCGMLTIELDEDTIDFEKLDAILNDGKTVPSGFNKRETAHKNLANTRLNELNCLDSIDLDTAEKSLGSLGGGNHFIEIDKSENGTFYLIIHTGSRHLGIDVCTYHQKQAIKACKSQDVNELITRLKSEGKTKEIQTELNKLHGSKVPDNLAYLSGDDLKAYLHDMKITQEYAVWNRKTIAEEIIKAMGWKVKSSFTTIHNYIDTDDMILRKGSISAKKDEIVLIPLSMRDGAIIAKGLGNPEWNCSAPHGAGRSLSRSKAKELLDVNEFAAQMAGIYTTCIGEATLDEAPDAYKPAESILENIKDTVDILEVIKPVYNFKAH